MNKRYANRYPQLLDEAFLRNEVAAGKSTYEIAYGIGCTTDTVRLRLRQAGIDNTRNKRKWFHLNESYIERLEDVKAVLLAAESMSQEKAAFKFHCSAATFHKALKAARQWRPYYYGHVRTSDEDGSLQIKLYSGPISNKTRCRYFVWTGITAEVLKAIMKGMSGIGEAGKTAILPIWNRNDGGDARAPESTNIELPRHIFLQAAYELSQEASEAELERAPDQVRQAVAEARLEYGLVK